MKTMPKNLSHTTAPWHLQQLELQPRLQSQAFKQNMRLFHKGSYLGLYRLQTRVPYKWYKQKAIIYSTKYFYTFFFKRRRTNL